MASNVAYQQCNAKAMLCSCFQIFLPSLVCSYIPYQLALVRIVGEDFEALEHVGCATPGTPGG